MSPGHNFVVNKLGTMNLEEIESDDIDDPDSLSKLDPDKSRSVNRRFSLAMR